jgi:hypothetical protein
MFYVKRCAAEAPYSAHFDELHEWTYHQSKHQAAVVGVKQVVDSSFPKAAGWQVRATQEQTRKFEQDQRKAEIGRENRKLVDRLQKISRGIGESEEQRARGRGPRAEPRGRGPRALMRPASATALLATSCDGEPQLAPLSLNETLRWKTQKAIHQDNLGLVRRILRTKSTFSRAREAEDFARHQRNGQLLRRLPEGRRSGLPRPLPPVGAPRSSMARELEGLFFLADLQRAGPGQLALEHSASAPAVGQFAVAQPDGFAGTLLPTASSTPEPREMAAKEPEATPGPAQTWGAQNFDQETERRRWSGDAVQEPAGHGDNIGPPMTSATSEALSGMLDDLCHMPTDALDRCIEDDITERPHRDAAAEHTAPCREDWNDASMTGESSSATRAFSGSLGHERGPEEPRQRASLGGEP